MAQGHEMAFFVIDIEEKQGTNVVVKVYDIIRATALHRDIIIDPFE